MPSLTLSSDRTCTVCTSLLDLPVERLLAYQLAMSPEAGTEAADELLFQQHLHQSVEADELSQLAFAASLEVFGASAQARAFVQLVTHIEQQPATDLSDQGLRDRLSYLLACGLTDEQVQVQHDRIAAELAVLVAPYLVTHPEAELRAVQVAQAQQRRVVTLCNVLLGGETPELTTLTQVTHALLDLLEPSTLLTDEVSSIHPQVRQHSFESLCLLLLHAQHDGRITLLPTPWQRKPNPYMLPLGLFLEHVRAVSSRLPA